MQILSRESGGLVLAGDEDELKSFAMDVLRIAGSTNETLELGGDTDEDENPVLTIAREELVEVEEDESLAD